MSTARLLQSRPSEPAGPLLTLRGLDKRFPGTHALKSVHLDFIEGEIHALAGENGAGKSTLIKLMTGVFARSGGEILWKGEPVPLATPQEAIDLGINVVHQEMLLCPHLTVAANMFLGHEESRMSLLNDRSMERKAQDTLDGLGFSLSAGTTLGSLPIGQQQLVATARAAMRGAKFIIFDEPTAYLTRRETDQLFHLIRRLNEKGVTIAYISHRLEEIFALADRVSVLRDGRLVSTRRIADTEEATLVSDMINRSITDLHYKEKVPFGEMLLEVEGLSGPGFEDVSLSVRRGEIVGLYGLIGAGRSEFVLSVFARQPVAAGSLRWKGAPFHPRRERDAIKAGIALAPESRRLQGLCLNLAISDNLNLTVFERLSRGFVINRRSEAHSAQRQIEDLQIVTSSRYVPVGHLSGGNQQKVVIGKWLNRGAELFIFDEPTVGVDVGTKLEIYKLFAQLLRAGAGIILISSYLPEVYDLSDTIHVFRHGRLASSYPRGDASQEALLAEAIGV